MERYDPLDVVTADDLAAVRSGNFRRAMEATDRVIARLRAQTAELRGERTALARSAREFYPPGHPRREAWLAELDAIAA